MSVAPPAWAKSEEGAALNAAAQAVDLTALQSLIDSGFHVDARDKVSQIYRHTFGSLNCDWTRSNYFAFNGVCSLRDERISTTPL